MTTDPLDLDAVAMAEANARSGIWHDPGCGTEDGSTCDCNSTRSTDAVAWLAFGPVPLADLARDMQCTRYALYTTLRTMPDVAVTYGPRHVATVTLAGARHGRAA